MGFNRKFGPFAAKIIGRAPLSPWRSILRDLAPGTWRITPPAMDIATVQVVADRHLLRFSGRHDFWFPRSMQISLELWSEYLACFWDHPANAHYYLRGAVTLGSQDVVMDCGACEGFFAMHALEAGARQVLCIEPSPEMVGCLEATFEKEIDEGRVTIIAVAVGSHCGDASFSSDAADAFSGRLDQEGTATTRIGVATIDSLTGCYGRPTFLKMDLEGFEYEALRGGLGLLEEGHPKLAITTYHYSWDYQVIRSFLHGIGYRRFRVSSSTMRGGKVPRPMMIHAW